MAISQEQQQRGLDQLKKIRRKYFNTSSEAADWWDKLTPEWRGVVLHAAAVNSGMTVFKAHLSKCCWRELFERLDYRAMIQLRCGISRARLRQPMPAPSHRRQRRPDRPGVSIRK